MDKAKVKETILTITIGFIALYMAFHHVWMLYVSFGVGLAGLLSGKLAGLIHKGWFKLADLLGYVMSRIVLGTLFFLVLVPVGAMAKLFRKDFMFLEKRNGSYYHERNHLYKPEDFTDPW
ncbi:MAG TPA: SxtJ family membrane protein [Bacteroidales bacterium]|nr:SxtJ family membrane protein [Bacteroidales bacterium]